MQVSHKGRLKESMLNNLPVSYDLFSIVSYTFLNVKVVAADFNKARRRTFFMIVKTSRWFISRLKTVQNTRAGTSVNQESWDETIQAAGDKRPVSPGITRL